MIKHKPNISSLLLTSIILISGCNGKSNSQTSDIQSEQPQTEPHIEQEENSQPQETEQPHHGSMPSTDNTNSAQLIASGNWSDNRIWKDKILPDDGDTILVPSGITLTVDGMVTKKIKRLNVEGTLNFSTDTNTQLLVDTLVTLSKGVLEIGTQAQPIGENVSAKIVFLDNGNINRQEDPMQLYRGAILMGPTQIWGAEKTAWTSFQTHPKQGDTTLTLSSEPIGWKAGDRLVVAATDINDPASDEVVIIESTQGKEIVITHALTKDHTALRQDLEVHVANLSRNIEFSSESAELMKRGHVMFMHNLDVNVNNARFYKLGRTDKTIPLDDYTWAGMGEFPPVKLEGDNIRGRYSVHFHRGGTGSTTTPAIVKGSVVEDNPGWAYVNHSSNVDFINNVSYKVIGGAFQTEAGDEEGSFVGNIALHTINPNDPLNCDCPSMDVEARGDRQDFSFQGDGFWLHNGIPRVEDNVVAGASGHAYIYWTEGLIETIGDQTSMRKIAANRFPNSHLLNSDNQIDVWYYPITSFKNNIGYTVTKGLETFYLHAHNFFTVEQQWVTSEYVEQLGSTFEDLTLWNVKVHGIGFNFTERVTLKNARIVGSGIENSIGIDADQYQNMTYYNFENVSIEGFDLGMDVPTEGNVNIIGGQFENKVDFRIENPQKTPRNLLFKDIEFVEGLNDYFSQRTHFDMAPDFTLGADTGGKLRNTALKTSLFFLLPDRITLDYAEHVDKGLFFNQQIPSFIPMTTENAAVTKTLSEPFEIPVEFVNKTNEQLKNSHNLYLGIAYIPDDAVVVDGIQGGKVGSKAPPAVSVPPFWD